MRFLICGLGSIGQRHYRNLKSLGYDDLIVYRTRSGANKDFVQKFTDEFHPVVFYDLDEALKQKPDAVFITNPTIFHMPLALKAAASGCNLFMEKPISHNWDGVLELCRLAENKKLVTYVGHQLRFHPLVETAKKWLEEGRIGKAVSAEAEMAERVTKWHPWEDYRQSYACRKNLGGGVLLAQVHEFDYLYWFFGPVKEVVSFYGKLGDLEMDVEDVAKVLIRFEQGVIASVSVDYLQFPARQLFHLVGTKGTLSWDYYNLRLKTYDGSADESVGLPEGFQRNDVYVAELRHFIDCVKHGKPTINDVRQGAEVLKIALLAKGEFGF